MRQANLVLGDSFNLELLEYSNRTVDVRTGHHDPPIRGPIDTPMLREGLTQEADLQRALREKAATVPLGRLADPAEVATAILFLAFEGTFATGTTMAFDGGTSAT